MELTILFLKQYQDLNDKEKFSLEFKEKTMQLEEQLREKEAQVNILLVVVYLFL